MKSKILEIEFNDIGKKKYVFRVDEPRDDIESLDIKEFANNIIENKLFYGSVGELKELNKAQIKTTTIEKVC